MKNSLLLTSILSMAGLGFFFAAVLAFAEKKLKVKDDPRIEEVLAHLPHTNCGACGFLSCRDLAENVVLKGADVGLCRVIDKETREKLYEITGEKGGDVYPHIALVHCAADSGNRKIKGEYKGVRTCVAAQLDFGAGLECQYGCMGFGDCCAVCPFDAIHMKNGLPVVDVAKCTGCGKCVEACPRNIISLAEKRHDTLFYVACSSRDDMLRTRKVCAVGCIACGICAKLSTEGFFSVTGNLSAPDYSKQLPEKVEELRKIAQKCPTKVIKEAR